jgi:hypothetical protein
MRAMRRRFMGIPFMRILQLACLPAWFWACGSRSGLDLEDAPAAEGGGRASGGQSLGGSSMNGGVLGNVGGRAIGGGSVSDGGKAASGGVSSGGAMIDPSCLAQAETVSASWSPGQQEVTGLALRGDLLALSWNTSPIGSSGAHWAVVRRGEMGEVKPELPTERGQMWVSRGVSVDSRGQVWGVVEDLEDPESNPPRFVRLEPPSPETLELSGVRVLDFASDGNGKLYVMVEQVDTSRAVHQVDPQNGEILWSVASQPGAVLAAMAVSQSGVVVVATERRDEASGKATWTATAVTSSQLLWEKDLGCRTGSLKLGVDADDNVYAVGATTCGLPGGVPISTEPAWETLPPEPSRPIVVHKLDQAGRFVWASRVRDADNGFYPIDLAFDLQGPVFLSTSWPADTFDQVNRVIQLDVDGRQLWSLDHCGNPQHIVSDGVCSLFLAGSLGCGVLNELPDLLQKFEGVEPFGP